MNTITFLNNSDLLLHTFAVHTYQSEAINQSGLTFEGDHVLVFSEKFWKLRVEMVRVEAIAI